MKSLERTKVNVIGGGFCVKGYSMLVIDDDVLIGMLRLLLLLLLGDAMLMNEECLDGTNIDNDGLGKVLLVVC